MAQRKAPQVDAVEDSSVADDAILARKDLDPHDFDRYTRMCFQGSTGAVDQLKKTCELHLVRLGKKPDRTKAVSKTPDASDNYNLQSLYRWMEAVGVRDRGAIKQLIVLHATACRRMGV